MTRRLLVATTFANAAANKTPKPSPMLKLDSLQVSLGTTRRCASLSGMTALSNYEIPDPSPCDCITEQVCLREWVP